MPTTPEPRTPSPEPLTALAAITLVVPVLLPLIVVFAPTLYLDADPRGLGDNAATTISFGPTGIMWLTAASILIAGFALGITVWAGGRIRWGGCLLVAAGIVPCLWHIPRHFSSRLHASAWIAAACLGLAAFHLAQFKRARCIAIAALIAILLPMAMQSVWYVNVEHPAAVEAFHDHLEQSLTARGLSPDSPEAVKYQTRLEGSDAIGAVGMSNVQGSIIASLLALTLIISLAAVRNKADRLRLLLLIPLIALGAWALLLTQSKGAVLALLAVIGLGSLLWLVRRTSPKLSKLAPALFILLIVAAIATVIVRGLFGPPDSAMGERSLLFRYHYWQGAARVLFHDPIGILLGVGVGPFKPLYEQFRNPISPEVVASTHNVFVDYIVMLGLGGLAWSALLLTWLWHAAQAWLRRFQPPSTQPPPPNDKPLRRFALLAAVLFLIQYAVQFPGLYAQTAILWLVGTLGFVAIATYLIDPILRRPGTQQLAAIALSLPAALILLHAQIEMTYFWISAAPFAWVVLGLAAGAAGETQTSPSQSKKPLRYLPAGVLLVIAVVFAIAFAEPTMRQQQRLHHASDILRLTHNPAAAIQELDDAADIIGNDPITTRWRIRLRQEIAAALWHVGRRSEARGLFDRSMSILDRARAQGLPELTTERLKSQLAYNMARITQDPTDLQRAEQTTKQAAALSPNDLDLHVLLGDIAWQRADFTAADAAYRRALKINNNSYLDPDAQLSEAERNRIESRINSPDSG